MLKGFIALFFLLNFCVLAVEIDHVTIAVHDLDKAATTLAKKGFVLKKPHRYQKGLQQGLTTQAIRFSSGQYLQLISFSKKDKKGKGVGLGELGKWYQKFLNSTEGGATVILKYGDKEEIRKTEKELNSQGLTCRLTQEAGFDWLSFKTYSPFQNLAFIHYKNPPSIGPELLAHANKVTGISKVRINPPGDPFQWAKIIRLSRASTVGLDFIDSGTFKEPDLFVREITLKRSLTPRASKKGQELASFTLGRTKIIFN